MGKYKGVIWTVYNVEISISSHQVILKKLNLKLKLEILFFLIFYKLEVFRNNSVLTNFRDTQQLYNRLVYRSFNSHSNSLLKSDYYTLFLIFFFHINYIL